MPSTTTQADIEVPASTETTPRKPKEALGRPFNVLLISTGLANTADGILVTALPLIAIEFTRSPQLISYITAAAWLPWLLFGAVAGVVIDRLDRRKLQLIGMTVRAGILIMLTVAAIQQWITVPMIIGFMVVYGITEVLIDLAASSMVPSVAPRSRLAAANSRVQAVQQVCNSFLGAPIAAGLLTLGAAWAIGVPAALGIAFIAVLGLGLRGSYAARRTVAPQQTKQPHQLSQVLQTLREDLSAGWKVVRHHQILRPLITSGALMNFANTAYFSVFVLWVVGEESKVGLTKEQFALLLMCLPVGAVIGSILSERLTERFAAARVMTGSWFITSGFLIVPALWPTLAGLIVACIGLGTFNTIGNVVSRTIRQQIIPERALGRVGGLASTLAYGLMPLGAIVGGIVAEQFGLFSLFIAVTVFTLIVSLWLVLRVKPELVTAAMAEQDERFAHVG